MQQRVFKLMLVKLFFKREISMSKKGTNAQTLNSISNETTK